MKKPRKKVPYKKPSKRNPMVDVQTDAARRAKILSAEKQASRVLREAIGNPTDSTGKPVAGHVVTSIAANRLTVTPGLSVVDDFAYFVKSFLGSLHYGHAHLISVASLWRTFIGQLEAADATFAAEVARDYEFAFRWFLAGFVPLIESEYDKQPNAVVSVEIWTVRKGKGHKPVAVQRDGNRRDLMPDAPPESPMLLRAGAKLREFLAYKDLKKMRQLGFKKFLAEIESGRCNLSPRAEKLLHEDTLINVMPPSDLDLAAFRREVSSWFSLARKWRTRKKRVT